MANSPKAAEIINDWLAKKLDFKREDTPQEELDFNWGIHRIEYQKRDLNSSVEFNDYVKYNLNLVDQCEVKSKSNALSHIDFRMYIKYINELLFNFLITWMIIY